MNTDRVDKITLKSIVREILREEPDLLKEIIKEIFVENEIIKTHTDEQAKRRKRLEKLIDTTFDEYDEVFKALA